MQTFQDRSAWRFPGLVAVVVEALVLAAFIAGYAHNAVGVRWGP